jgi:uncharacterized oxidoreductase
MEAGFDGVQILASYLYLISQFLNATTNLRKDEYGGSLENRSRFLFEVVESVLGEVDAQRIGVKISPMHEGGAFEANDETLPVTEYAIQKLSAYKLSHLLLMGNTTDFSGTPLEELAGDGMFQHFRPLFKGTLIANVNIDRDRGNRLIEEGLADLVAFGRPYIANPDLVRRFAENAPLPKWIGKPFMPRGRAAIPTTQPTNHHEITPRADHVKDNIHTEKGDRSQSLRYSFHTTCAHTQIGDIMNLTRNTIFITGGGSGIGRALAEELHKRGNKVIISGRRKSHLDSVAKANPGIEAVELDVGDPDNIKAVAKKLTAEHPDLNVLINNAGIMELDHAAGVIDDRSLVSTVTTNLLGPIRLTSALVDQLKSRHGVILYNTSVLGFVPLAVTAVYSATKAALHSYALSQRFLLRDSGVRVLEMAPPWVRTELMNSQEAEQAMPLDQFISETLDVLGTDADEILVEAAKPLRANPGPKEQALVNGFNEQMLKLFVPSQA